MATINDDDSRLSFMPETNVLKASGTVVAYHNYWWCVHPIKGLVYWGKGNSPQCNFNQAVSASIRERMYPWSEVKQIPLVLVPMDPHDYV